MDYVLIRFIYLEMQIGIHSCYPTTSLPLLATVVYQNSFAVSFKIYEVVFHHPMAILLITSLLRHKYI